MILCPNCQHTEIAGAVFCSNCGSQLVQLAAPKTQEIHSTETRSQSANPPLIQATPSVQLNTWVSLHMVESGQIISLAGQNEFTLGRISEGQPIMPDVDLTSFNAYANGVSRLHCVIRREDKTTSIMDLGSSNGTYQNGIKLSPQIKTSIYHGDIISLGKLKIQILINQDQAK